MLLLSHMIIVPLSTLRPALAPADQAHQHHCHHSAAESSADAMPASGAVHMTMQMHFEVPAALRLLKPFKRYCSWCTAWIVKAALPTSGS